MSGNSHSLARCSAYGAGVGAYGTLCCLILGRVLAARRQRAFRICTGEMGSVHKHKRM